jgi:phosphoadenosine phosphosulfate reductase
MIDLATEADRAIDEALEAGGDVCVTSSFQAECVALVHMLIIRRPRIPVVFLDTGYHFPQTMEYRDRIAADWNLNLKSLTPALTVAAQESQFGILYQSQPDRCCKMRKVEPLFAELENYDTWFTGLRREQSKSRADLRIHDTFHLPTGKHLRKISPLADWSTQSVWAYLREHRIPVLSLYDEGYSSIGCAPCTSLPLDPDDPRSGRWSGKKLECGIHLQGSSSVVRGPSLEDSTRHEPLTTNH